MSDLAVFTDPSTDSPKLSFNTGATVDGQAVMNPVLPNIPGPVSAWRISEWSQPSYLDPAVMVVNASSDASTLYGNALFAWHAADSQTAVRLYSQNSGAASPLVYDLQEAGSPDASSGADLFLSSSALQPDISFNHPISFSMDAQLIEADAQYNNPATAAYSIVLAALLAGFTVTFNAPWSSTYDPSEPVYSVFLQIDIGSSRQTGANQPPLPTYVSSTDSSSSDTIIYTSRLPGDPYLPYQSTSTGPTLLHYDLNSYLDDMIVTAGLPSFTQDLSRWTLGSMYVGLESQNGISPDSTAGSIITRLDLSNISVTTDQNTDLTFAASARSSAMTSPADSIEPPAPLFSLTSGSTGLTQSITMDNYTGPISFLAHGDAISYNGSDNVELSALSARNPLMATGAGNDVLTSTTQGVSILDGGTGANIETGQGPGQASFIQNGYVTGQTWDFLKNFHGNDQDIIFGFLPGLSKISVQGTGGAGAYIGVTVTVLPGNGNCEAITFVGDAPSSIQGCATTIDAIPSFVIWTKDA